MPNRWPISSGNWSNAAIWSGSIIPTASDDVFANNQIVTVDTNIQVLSLGNGSATGVAAGGRFNLANGITVTSTSTSAFRPSSVVLMQITGSDTATIIASTVQGSSAADVLLISQSANIIISGSVIGGTGIAVRAITHASSGTLTITGSVRGGVFNVAHGILFSGTGVINISGSVEGGNGGPGHGISSTSTGTINVTGSIIAGNITSGISTTTAGNITVRGSIISSPNTPGISSTSTSATVRVTGPLINQNNINAVYSPKIQLISNSTPTYTLQSNTFPRSVTFYDSAYTSSLPTQTNVRSGSLYGGSNEFSGSMVVPLTSSVRYGVPVDNVIGSATLTPQNIFDFATQNLTGSNTIGERLKNISTVQTTAATIAAFKGK